MNTSLASTNTVTPSTLPVRKLLVDLSQGFERHWFRRPSGQPDAYRSMYFDALSMSFPAGEQFFIDSVNALKGRLPDTTEYAALMSLTRDFAAQEATHRQVHGLMNAQLEKQGLTNTWEPRIWERNKRYAHLNPLHHLAITAAYEHYTSVMADLLLSHPALSEGMCRPMRQLWLWHAMEETEHKAVAFDLYQALSGNANWRRRWYLMTMVIFMIDTCRQVTRNLWQDGSLFKPSTWLSFLQFFWGRPSRGGGWFWLATPALLAYMKRDFHPNQLGKTGLAQDYAEAHGADWRLIR